MRSKRMQALNPFRHPARRLSPTRQRLQPFIDGSSVPASNVVFVRLGVGGFQLTVFRQPGGHLPHQPA